MIKNQEYFLADRVSTETDKERLFLSAISLTQPGD